MCFAYWMVSTHCEAPEFEQKRDLSAKDIG